MKTTKWKLTLLIIHLFLAALCLCTACGKTPSCESERSKGEDDEWEKIYAYETPFVFTQERIGAEVGYIDGMEQLVDQAVKIICETMQRGHDTGDWKSGDIWWAYPSDDSDLTVYDGRGFYISRLPITQYNNNRNRLLNSFTLFILNEDQTVVGSASVSNINGRKLKVAMLPNAVTFGIDYFAIAQEMPDMEFVNLHANYLKDPSRVGQGNPNVMSGYVNEAYASYPLGEDNQVYRYDEYAEKVKEQNSFKYGEPWTVEGDVFHSLPEEMRYSYSKFMENLIWVEYQD